MEVEVVTYLSQENTLLLSRILKPSLIPQKPNASMTGKTEVKIRVETRVFPITKNQSSSKSEYAPPFKPKSNFYSLRLQLTRRSKKPVLKNCTAKVTLVVSRSLIVSVLYPIQATRAMQTVLRTKLTPVMKYLRELSHTKTSRTLY